MPKERKNILCMDAQRHAEYYGMQQTFDELYAKSKAGEVFNGLMELVLSPDNIMLAYRNIKTNTGSYTAGTDKQNIGDIGRLPPAEVIGKVRKIVTGSEHGYRPKPVRRKDIPKPNGKTRPLGIPCIWDRLVQQCIKQILEPICEAKFSNNSYGFRPNRSVEHAISRTYSLLQRAHLHYVLEFDIKGFFDNVNHSKLIKQLWTLGIQDKQLLFVIRRILKAPIRMPDGSTIYPTKGTPQGGIISPLLANVALNELDHWIDSQWTEHPVANRYGAWRTIRTSEVFDKSKGYQKMRNSNLKEMFIVRYADDFRIFCRNREDAEKTMEAVTRWISERLKLEVSPEKTRIVNERYGRDIAMDEQGRFTDEGYVRVASERWDRQFDGELDDIPDEYRIIGSGEAAERDSTIAVLVVEPGKEPYVKEIDSGLESLQHEVGGCIEAIYPYEDPVALVCNEEGKLEGLPLNRALRDEDGDIYDVVAGTFMVVGLTDDSFGSLTVEQMQKFADHFKVPEQFVKLGDKIVAIPMISKEQQKQESIEQKDFEMNADTSGLTVAGHIGTWHTIDQHEVGGHSFYLMEHDAYGDEAACVIVDERGKLVLDDVYNGFDDDTLRLLDLEVKEVPEMPDPALSVQDMKDYGYAWAGVLPAGQEAAEKALEKGCEVYHLYSDNTEGLCVDAKEIADHAAKGGMLGISKESWMAVLEKENYLKAAEMSMEDDYGMIDGIINNGPKEDKTAEVKAPERGEKSSIMDRLKSAKAEKQKECCPPQKHKGEIEL